jgi:ABC-type polysaccharide/polyol phosphate export permease
MRYKRRTPPIVLTDTLTSKGMNMLWTIAVILVIMWLLGMVTSYTLGGLLHLLLVLALIAVLIRIIQGRNPI